MEFIGRNRSKVKKTLERSAQFIASEMLSPQNNSKNNAMGEAFTKNALPNYGNSSKHYWQIMPHY